MHNEDLFFQYRYGTMDIVREIDSMPTFNDYDSFYTYNMAGKNGLLAKYLSKLPMRHKVKPEVFSIEIGYFLTAVFEKMQQGIEMIPDGRFYWQSVPTFMQSWRKHKHFFAIQVSGRCMQEEKGMQSFGLL